MDRLRTIATNTTTADTPAPSSEGHIPFKIPGVEESCSTYYKVYGTLSPSSVPLILLHGGPGVGCDYLNHFSSLWTTRSIPIIAYDQIGCGRSSLVREKASDASFWVEDLFVRELDNLVDHFSLRESGYDVYGHSWGGMLGPAYAAGRPRGLRRLIAAHGAPSKRLVEKATIIIGEMLEEPYRSTFLEGYRTENPELEGYREAEARFYCRVSNVEKLEDVPKELPELIKVGDASTAHDVMWCKKRSQGSLAGWTVMERLHQIEVPVLIISGKYDHVAQEVSQKPFFELIPRVRWYHFEQAGHAPWLESEAQRKKYFNLIADFLTPSKAEDINPNCTVAQ